MDKTAGMGIETHSEPLFLPGWRLSLSGRYPMVTDLKFVETESGPLFL